MYRKEYFAILLLTASYRALLDLYAFARLGQHQMKNVNLTLAYVVVGVLYDNLPHRM